LAEIASRYSLVGALLRKAVPAKRHSVFTFLRGLSRDELECLAEFQGACILESDYPGYNAYRLMADYFDPNYSARWGNSSDDRAHKTFVVLAYLDLLERTVSVVPDSVRPELSIF
jgi:hypothetical protein